MVRLRLILVFGLVSSSALFAPSDDILPASSTPELIVTHAEPPDYPPALHGDPRVEVRVSVEITPDGHVGAGRAETGSTFLTPYAEAAASRWTFNSTPDGPTREALITFIFAGVEEVVGPGGVVVSFD